MKVSDMWKIGKRPDRHVFERKGAYCHVFSGCDFATLIEAENDYWECVEMEHDIDTSRFMSRQDELAERLHYGCAADMPKRQTQQLINPTPEGIRQFL